MKYEHSVCKTVHVMLHVIAVGKDTFKTDDGQMVEYYAGLLDTGDSVKLSKGVYDMLINREDSDYNLSITGLYKARLTV